MYFKSHFLIFFYAFLSVGLYGQEVFKDTLKVTVKQADSIFLLQNLALIAEKCNVDAAKAQIIQAKLFSNINVGVNQNLVNTEYKTNGGRKWLDNSSHGEMSVQVQKLFLLAGKHNKQIKLAELSANKEEQAYFDLLRTLKYTLHSGFYRIYYLNQTIKVYDKEIASMGNLIDVYQKQFDKGNISKKELLRLKAALFSLENEKLEYLSKLISSQADFNVLMHSSETFYLPQHDTSQLDQIFKNEVTLKTLIDTAFSCRYDLKEAQSDLSLSQTNLAYQKAMAVPDITLSTGWDKNGGYVRNYNFIGLQMDLPFFNRNQGNIKSARFLAESSKCKVQGVEDEIKAEVASAYSNALEIDRLYRSFDRSFVSGLEALNEEMVKNFEKKNISLIEFLDYYDAYKANSVQLNSLLCNRMNAIENMNYSVGKEIFPQ